MMKKILSTLFVLTCLLLINVIQACEKIAIIGSGYVGLVAGAGLASFGNQVICADIDATKIQQLQQAKLPIYEPQLAELLHEQNRLNRIQYTTDIASAIAGSDIIFIAVGTPMTDTGEANLTYVYDVAKTIGQNLNTYKIICTKSTVPIGTGSEIKQTISKYNKKNIAFDVVSNPEFLREGMAVQDFLQPNRIVIGTDQQRAIHKINNIYKPLIQKKVPFLYTDIITAEMIKYASNAFLATKVSYINEIAALCEITGADVKQVATGMGLDRRIGREFLKAGPGFGGSCFPKDAQALLFTARNKGAKLNIVKAALKVNELQKQRIFTKVERLLDNNLASKRIAILGLAFKAHTDDIRYSPAIPLIERLLAQNADVHAYDPMANDNMQKIIPYITYHASWQEAVKDAECIVILTDWPECNIDLDLCAQLVRKKAILDARNILNTRDLKRLHFNYLNIGNADAKK